MQPVRIAGPELSRRRTRDPEFRWIHPQGLRILPNLIRNYLLVRGFALFFFKIRIHAAADIYRCSPAVVVKDAS